MKTLITFYYTDLTKRWGSQVPGWWRMTRKSRGWQL